MIRAVFLPLTCLDVISINILFAVIYHILRLLIPIG